MQPFETVIEGLAYRGGGVAHHEGKAIFVSGGVPGDRVRVRTTRSKKRYSEAVIEEVLEPSADRVTPICPVFEQCGGCQWQHIRYEAQVDAKRDILAETLARIGGIEVPEVEFVRAPLPYGYRQRVRFQVSEGVLGFFPRKGREIVEVAGCPVLVPELNGRIEELAKRARDEHFTGQVSLATGGREPEWTRRSDAPQFPFAQANGPINTVLTKRIAEIAAEPPGDGPIYDFFCGDGNLSMALALAGESVKGWDISRSAIEAAQSKAARLPDAEYRRRSIASMDLHFFRDAPSPRVIIVDPPRRGLKAGGEFVPELGASRVLYVSCSPPDLSRDLALFTAHGYRLSSLMGLDMFPQTYHFEVLAVLDLV